MKRSLLPLLACPECRGELSLAPGSPEGDEVLSGELRCPAAHTFQIVDAIPRFVPPENYADSFGFQWNQFAKTQLDEEGGSLSKDRFFQETRWPKSLAGEVILEAGAGAGRFTGHAATTGATIVSLDYSKAIDAARRNNAHHANIHFLQGDIRKIPLKPGSCDKVYCFGVLQHTPDPEASFKALVPFLKKGGQIVVDVYRLSWRSIFFGRYYLRPITKRIPPRRLFPLVQAYVKTLYPALGLAHRVLGPRALTVSSVLGVSDYRTVWDLPPERLYELSLLDTFDALSPAHDHPQTLATVRRWLEAAGLEEIEVTPGYNGIEARGRAPL